MRLSSTVISYSKTGLVTEPIRKNQF